MKKYFLHNGTESSGPFDFEEIKAKKITPKTPVWFQGMEKWKMAGAIPELAELFSVQPPPLDLKIEKQTIEITTSVDLKNEGLGLSNYRIPMIIGAVILIASTIVFKILETDKKEELDAINKKTETENYQLELQKKQIEEEKILREEAEKKAEEQRIEEKKRSNANRIIEIEKRISISETNLVEAKEKLKSATDFKLLRTSDEKKVQMQEYQSKIDSITSEIDQLKIESNRLKLELEKQKN